MMKSIWKNPFVVCGVVWLGFTGQVMAGMAVRERIKPDLRKGELIRLSAKVGEVSAGGCYIYTKKIRKRGQDYLIKATLRAKTNKFFDKVHHVNNLFSSTFGMLSGSRSSFSIKVDQAGAKLNRSMSFRTHGRHGMVKMTEKYTQWRNKPFKRTYKRKVRVPTNTFNLLRVLYYARFLNYQPKQTHTFYIYVARRLWRIDGKLHKKTKLYTILGAKRALMIKATARLLYRGAKARKLNLWLSDDAQRMPLKIQGHIKYIGTATAELVGYRRSSRSRYLDGTQKRRKRRRGGRLWRFLSKF